MDVFTHGVAVKRLEEIHGLLEEVWYFLLGSIASVATGLESADTSAMLGPFMLPEGLVIAVDVNPVGIHVGQQVCLAI